ncbi:MAG: endo-1,4-beta-xylanase [Planctomycetota bacterium]
MLRFFVLRGGRPADAWPLHHAMLVAADGSTAQGRARVEAGMLIAETETASPVSLELLTPLEGGAEARDRELMLSTTLLPHRERPYLLSLELARKQVMRFLNALESWNLADIPPDGTAMQTFNRARQDFSTAVVAWRSVRVDDGDADMDGVIAADRLARRALVDAVEAGEELVREATARGIAARSDGSVFKDALARAERSLGRTAESTIAVVKAPETSGVAMAGVAKLGCTVSPRRFDDASQSAAARAAEFVSVPMPWREIEPSEGTYAFAGTDRWIEWAIRKAKLPVTVGPIIDLDPDALPEWLFIWENDYDTLREIFYEHMRQVVTRYRRTVQWWTLASSLGVEGGLNLRFEQIADLLRVATTVARKLHPQGRVQVELVDPFAAYAARTPRTLPPLLLGELIAQAGINVDAIALRVDLTGEGPRSVVRDAMAFSEMLDRYAEFDRPLAVTGLLCPAGAADTSTGHEHGHWDGPWSPQIQARWLETMASVAASKPFVHSICWGAASDADGGRAGLVDAGGQPRPALASMAQLRGTLRQGVGEALPT